MLIFILWIICFFLMLFDYICDTQHFAIPNFILIIIILILLSIGILK